MIRKFSQFIISIVEERDLVKTDLVKSSKIYSAFSFSWAPAFINDDYNPGKLSENLFRNRK